MLLLQDKGTLNVLKWTLFFPVTSFVNLSIFCCLLSDSAIIYMVNLPCIVYDIVTMYVYRQQIY